MDALERDFHEAPDPFVFVIEQAAFCSTPHNFDCLQRALQELALNEPRDLRIRTLLGLLYAKRVHSEESCAELVDAVAAVASEATGDRELELLANLVGGVLLIARGGKFSDGIVQLEDVRNELRHGSAGALYGVVQRWLGYAYMFIGRVADAEIAYQDAVATSRRYEMSFLYATALNDHAVLKKRMGQYLVAREMLREAADAFGRMQAFRNKLFAKISLGNVAKRLGEWRAAERCFREAQEILHANMVPATQSDTQLGTSCMTTLEHLLIQRRLFTSAEKGLLDIAAMEDGIQNYRYVVALAHEFLGELNTELGDNEAASNHLERAYTITVGTLPESDVMTEVLRRMAQLDLNREQFDQSKAYALRCIHLSRKIGDRYELGAATRVLGEVYAATGDVKRAKACFAAAVRGLKSIHECYELMRTLYAQGKFLAQHGKRDEAEISLLEARQLAKKLELDYYQALIAVALVDALTPLERFSEASTWLTEAIALRDGLEGVDRDRVEKHVHRTSNELQVAITRASVREAETLKTICRVYEDARFPIAEMKPDLAYQVAQSVGGNWLFVAARRGGGFTVPLTYNISVNDAKDVVRQLDAGPKKPLFGMEDEPRVITLASGRTLVVVPCLVTPSSNGKEKNTETYAFCTCFDQTATITTRQMEILSASAEALARLIEDEDERHAPPTPEELARVRHPRGSFKDILTIDPGMIKVIKLAEKSANSVAPILLEGETGVGKELFARAIHEASKRKDGPFVAVNAGGMSVSLLESELFGHVKGAFTDAGSDRQGFVDTARGGTLFLDEVGEMGEELQVKLLRLLENGEYRRLGESTMRKADVRVISATNVDLAKEVDRGKFRRDLYYRIAPLKVSIPPLRLRTSDIQLMVRHFLRDCAQMNGIADRYIEIDVKAMEALELYDWPGNVRELHNEILRVVSLIGRGDLVRFNMLSDHIQEHLRAKKRGHEGLLERSVEQFERRLILHALERNDWNHLRTAESIGVPRTTLIAKLKRLNIPTKI